MNHKTSLVMIALGLGLFAFGAACVEDPHHAHVEVPPQDLPPAEPDVIDLGNGTPNGAFIWRGLNHRWTYNHRLNRYGDWVRPGTCTGTGNNFECETRAFHTAASGTGADDVSWDSFHTFVKTESAEFLHPKRTITLSGAEGNSLAGSLDVTVVTNQPINTAILRGFDIVATDTADQLTELEIEVDNLWYNAATGEFIFTINVSGTFDCPTPECPVFNSTVNYDVEVFTTVVSGEWENFHWQWTTVGNEYAWDDYQGPINWSHPLGLYPENEIFRADHRVNNQAVTGLGGGDYPNAVLGFRRLSVGLDRDHHMLDLDMAVLPQSYNAQSGTFDFDMRLFFKQWTADGNVLTFERPGDVEFSADVIMLQFGDGCTDHGNVGGVMSWPGGNAPATGNDARTNRLITGQCN